MKCNLVKKTNTIEVEGQKRSFTNYYLVFDNDVVLPIVAKFYTTKSTKKEDIEKVSKLNTRNATKLDTLADSVKDNK